MTRQINILTRGCKDDRRAFHMMKFKLSYLLLLLSFSTSAWAQEDPFLNRIHLWAGGDAGYNRIAASRTNELSKDGYQLDVSGFASTSLEDVTVELGGGWLYNVSEGETSTGTVLNDKITTKAGFAHLVGRYRISPEWEIGMANRLLFGADARFQSSTAADNRVHWFAGLQGVYRAPFRFPLQLSATALTDVTVSGRQIYQFLFGLHVGFGIFDFGTDETFAPVKTKEVQKIKVESVVQPAPAVPEVVTVQVQVPEPKRTYVLDLQRIQFDFDSAKLKPQAKEMLKKVGMFLATHQDAWNHLTIEGHTDQIGSNAYNLKLSQARAESVRTELLANGVGEDAVLAKGLSFSEPLVQENTALDRQKNRRVEFEFEGIQDPEALDEFFQKINQAY